MITSSETTAPSGDWRLDLLNLVYRALLVLAVPLLLYYGLTGTWVFLLFAVVILVCSEARRIGQVPRAVILSLFFISLGLYSMTLYGMSGARISILLGIVSTVILANSAFMVSMSVLSVGGMSLIAWLWINGTLTATAPFSNAVLYADSSAWILYILSFVAATGILIMATQFVIRRLEGAVAQTREESREKERALDNFRFLASNASDVIWTMDLDLNFTYVSPSVMKVRGYTPEEAMAQGASSVVVESDAVNLRRLLQTGLAREGVQPHNRARLFESKVRHKSGALIDVEIQVSFLRDDQDEPIGLIGVTRDISARKRLETVIRKIIEGTTGSVGEDLFGSLVRNLSEALDAPIAFVGERSGDQTIQTISVWQDGAVGDNFTYALAGTPCEDVLSAGVCCIPDNVQNLYPEDDLLAEMGVASYLGSPLRDHEGNVIGIIVMLHREPIEDADLASDVLAVFAQLAASELSRRRAEHSRDSYRDQLLQSQKLESIGQLTGGIAHDFNNLLVVIGGYVDLLELKIPRHDEARGYIKHISDAATKAGALTKQLLAFSRRQIMDVKPFSVDGLIEDIGTLLKRTLPANIPYRFIDGAPDHFILADPNQLEQALLNLVLNSRDAMPQGGALTIETWYAQVDDQFVRQHPGAIPGTYVCIEVRDEGTGISREVQQRMFEPFYTTKPSGVGTGLGLSVVFGVVSQHDGFILVDSRMGRGTTFKLFMPTTSERPEDDGSSPMLAAESGHERILVIEDMADVRALTEELLLEAGYEVVTAASGEEGIDRFGMSPASYDLVLLDVVLPGQSGEQVGQALLEARPDIEILYTSGYSAHALHSDFILNENITLLPKPYGRQELLKAVREMLDSQDPARG